VDGNCFTNFGRGVGGRASGCVGGVESGGVNRCKYALASRFVEVDDNTDRYKSYHSHPCQLLIRNWGGRKKQKPDYF